MSQEPLLNVEFSRAVAALEKQFERIQELSRLGKEKYYSIDQLLTKTTKWLENSRALLDRIFCDRSIAGSFDDTLKNKYQALNQMPYFVNFETLLDELGDDLEGLIDRLKLYEPSNIADSSVSLKSEISDSTDLTSESMIGLRKIFVVHGHSDSTKEATARIISQLGYEPIILHEQANLGKTVIEKVEHYSDVVFAIILLTADDVGGIKDSGTLMNRARQNVVFEFGYFISRLGRNRVCALVEEGVERPSDIDGVVYIPIDKGGAWRQGVAREMRSAGLNIDMNKLN